MFRLCLALGCAHPDYLLSSLSSSQLSEWEAYNKIDPIGQWRSDFRMANLASVITNIARSLYSKQGTKMSTPLDFMPMWEKEQEKPKKKQTIEDMKSFMLGLVNKK